MQTSVAMDNPTYLILQPLSKLRRSLLPLLEEIALFSKSVEPDGTSYGEDTNCVGNQGPIGDDKAHSVVEALKDTTNRNHPGYDEHNAQGKTS